MHPASLKIIIAGGGTGGHIFPAVSIGEEILGRDAGNRVLFVGTKKGMETKVLSTMGYRLEYISSGGIVGRGMVQRVKGVALAVKGFFDSLGIIGRFNPDVVVGVGGYVSGPLILAAWALRIPTAICEQNAVPGITNKILGRLVRRVFVTFEESGDFFAGNKTMTVGNPVRKIIFLERAYKPPQNGFSILVFGGSQGAHKLNLTVPEAFGILGRRDVLLTHQTGDKDLEDVGKAYERLGVPAEVLPFIENIGSAYVNSDLVIGRAGAGTVAEITAIGKPAVLVPYPFSTYNHQLANAKALQKAGAAVVIEEKDITPESLAEILSGLLKRERLEEMGEKARRLGRPDAAKRIVDEIYRLAEM